MPANRDRAEIERRRQLKGISRFFILLLRKNISAAGGGDEADRKKWR